MKAIFPCKGVVVLTKHNVNVLKDFYTDNLINSQIFPLYQSSNYPVQLGALSYLPQDSKIILQNNTNLLTIKQLTEVLSSSIKSSNNSNIPTKNVNENSVEDSIADSNQNLYDDNILNNDNTPLDDNFLLKHPFFETLKPLD